MLLTCFKKPSSPTAFNNPLTSIEPSRRMYNGLPSAKIDQDNAENMLATTGVLPLKSSITLNTNSL